MRQFLRHFFLPHESNNHRAKLLHPHSLIGIISILFVLGVVIAPLKHTYPQILGTQTSVSIQELLELTNKKRVAEGLKPLSLNQSLSNAAAKKASDMIEKNYWAHFAPDGGTPWGFIKEEGYEYAYAGENLARGFSTSNAAVEAWIASPSHKENLLSKNYSDVGFAVITGKLTGEETVLIVQMFGSTGSTLAKSTPEVGKEAPHIVAPAISNGQVAAVETRPLVNTTEVGKQIAISIVLLFALIIVFDLIIIERRKIVRILSHNFDHLLYLSFISGMIYLITKGNIL